MRVLVCGGRSYGAVPAHEVRYTPSWYRARERAQAERSLLGDTLSNCRQKGMSLLIHGAAKGADTLALRWAVERGLPERGFPAPWEDLEHPDARVKMLPSGRRYDANAGPRRNAQMIAEGKPDLVIAFPGGKGTADMIRQAEAAGVPVVKVDLTPSAPLSGEGR